MEEQGPSERPSDPATVRRHAEYGGQTPLTKSGNSRPKVQRRGCEDSAWVVAQPRSRSAASAALCMPAKCLNAITARGRVELSGAERRSDNDECKKSPKAERDKDGSGIRAAAIGFYSDISEEKRGRTGWKDQGVPN